MEEQFMDDDNNMITECPSCTDQHSFYMIRDNKIMEGLHTQWCSNCKKPYVINVRPVIKISMETFGCYPTERNKQGFLEEKKNG